ncbi:MAG: glycosyltransferase family 2 protein, partial [Calditrichaeota bacterium]|nr:glycosyltransferase family 2 protein [Calditrichota bacterium]
MNITVIIATKNRYHDLHKCLNSLLEQTRLPQKIVIVDASEPFHTLEEFETRCRKKKIELLQIKSKPGLTLQRNIGIEHASTEIVSFFDDDVILHKEYLQSIVEIFEADSGKRIGGVTGKILNQTDFHPLSILLRKIFLLPEPSKGEVKP